MALGRGFFSSSVVLQGWYARPVVTVRRKFPIWAEKMDAILAENPSINVSLGTILTQRPEQPLRSVFRRRIWFGQGKPVDVEEDTKSSALVRAISRGIPRSIFSFAQSCTPV